jgi:serine/threonine protein kinase
MIRNVVLVSLLGLRGAVGVFSEFDKLAIKEYDRAESLLLRGSLVFEGHEHFPCVGPKLVLHVKNSDGTDVAFRILDLVDHRNGKIFGYQSWNPNFLLKEIVFNFRSGYWLLHMVRERAALELLEDDPDVPHVYPIAEVGEACKVRMLVTDSVGARELKTLALYVKKPHERASKITRIGARAIGILERIHKKGIVHGDVHGGNFMLNDAFDPESLKISNFGFAESYVDGQGQHRPNVQQELREGITYSLLSPWELNRETKSRRDDMYRLAETLLQAGGYDTWFETNIKNLEGTIARQVRARFEFESTPGFLEKMKEWKPQRILEPKTTPQVLIDFFKYCLELGYDAEPDYVYWIHLFNEDSVKRSQSQKPSLVSQATNFLSRRLGHLFN